MDIYVGINIVDKRNSSYSQFDFLKLKILNFNILSIFTQTLKEKNSRINSQKLIGIIICGLSLFVGITKENNGQNE